VKFVGVSKDDKGKIYMVTEFCDGEGCSLTPHKEKKSPKKKKKRRKKKEEEKKKKEKKRKEKKRRKRGKRIGGGEKAKKQKASNNHRPKNKINRGSPSALSKHRHSLEEKSCHCPWSC